MEKSIDELLQMLLHDGSREFTQADRKRLQFYFTTEEGRLLVFNWFDRQVKHHDSTDADYTAMFIRIENTLGIAKPARRVESPFSRNRVLRIAQKCAAVLLIPLLSGFLYLLFTRGDDPTPSPALLGSREAYKEYFSPAGARLKVLLPDSTVVWLNGSSSLKVSESFGRYNRNVELTGEGNFHVRHNSKLFFTVTAGNLNVRATGTVFNINAYPDSPIVEAVLISGKVEVRSADRLNREVHELASNERAVYSKEANGIVVTKVNTSSYKAWPQGRLVFDNKSLADVATIMEHWYNVKVKLLDAELAEHRFSANLDECSLEQLLRYIGYSSPITYTIDKNNITIRIKK